MVGPAHCLTRLDSDIIYVLKMPQATVACMACQIVPFVGSQIMPLYGQQSMPFNGPYKRRPPRDMTVSRAETKSLYKR